MRCSEFTLEKGEMNKLNKVQTLQEANTTQNTLHFAPETREKGK